MTLTYTDLKTKAASWVKRAGVSTYITEVPDFIALAEARLNREFGDVESDNTLTGTVDSRRIDISSLNVTEPAALFLAETGQDEVPIQLQKDGSFPYLATSGRPSQAALDENNSYIDFDRPLDSAYPFRFRAKGKLGLSDAVQTNWLLTDHPDVYLAATLMWGAGYLQTWPNGQVWQSVLEDGIASVKHHLAKQSRGVLRVDDALLSIGRPTYQQLINGEF